MEKKILTLNLGHFEDLQKNTEDVTKNYFATAETLNTSRKKKKDNFSAYDPIE